MKNLIFAAGAGFMIALLAFRRSKRRAAMVPAAVGYNRELRGASRFPRKGDDISADDTIPDE